MAILFYINIGVLIIFTIFLLFVKKDTLKPIYIICFILFIFIQVSIIFLIVKKEQIDQSFYVIMSAIAGLASVVTVSYFSYKSNILNKEVQTTNFMTNLLDSHYKVLSDQQEAISELMQTLIVKVKYNESKLDYLTKEFIKELNNNPQSKSAVTEIMGNSDYSGIKTHFNKLNKYLTDGITDNLDESLQRIIMGFFNFKENSFVSKFPQYDKVKIIESSYFTKMEGGNCFFNNILNSFRSRVLDEVEKNPDFEDTSKLIDSIFSDNYGSVGHFFRNSHRIVKTINEIYGGKHKVEEKNKYLGLLRSYYSEDIILAVYYNSVYTNKGLGYAIQLFGSDFFGNEDDLKTKANLQHFRLEKLLHEQKDLAIMRKLFVCCINDQFNEKPSKEVLKEKLKNVFDEN